MQANSSLGADRTRQTLDPVAQDSCCRFQFDVANRDLASNRTASDNHAAKARSALVSSTIPRSDSITLPRGASRVAQ